MSAELKLLKDFKGEMLGLIIHYNTDVLDIVEGILKNHTAICYVSVATPQEVVQRELKKRKIDTKSIFFIDLITQSLTDIQSPAINVVFGNSNDLTTLSLTILKALETKKFEALIIDSLSALKAYNGEDSLNQFVEGIFKRIKGTFKLTVLIVVLESDVKSPVVGKISTIADKLLRYKEDIF